MVGLTSHVVERGWRYTLVGMLCALGNYIAMLVVDFADGHYLLGILCGFLCVTPLGYFLHSRFTFRRPLSAAAFGRYAAGVIAAYPLATAVIAGLCSGLHMNIAVAYPIAVLVMVAWNYESAHWAILPRLAFSPVSASPTNQSAPLRSDAKQGVA